jgi:hypothetical protein
MVAFYRDSLGMQVTKQNWQSGIVFLSADPEAVDHEIALIRGRPDSSDPHLINQISLRVATLEEPNGTVLGHGPPLLGADRGADRPRAA